MIVEKKFLKFSCEKVTYFRAFAFFLLMLNFCFYLKQNFKSFYNHVNSWEIYRMWRFYPLRRVYLWGAMSSQFDDVARRWDWHPSLSMSFCTHLEFSPRLISCCWRFFALMISRQGWSPNAGGITTVRGDPHSQRQ